MKDAHTFEEMILSDSQFALLLGISLAEFLSLKRTGLYAYINPIGIIEEYFMYIHPGNLQNVLLKMKIGADNFIRFNYEEMRSFTVNDLTKIPEEHFSII